MAGRLFGRPVVHSAIAERRDRGSECRPPPTADRDRGGLCLFAQVRPRAAEYRRVPVEDVFSRVQEIAGLAGRAGDPSIARATVGAFPGLLAQASPQLAGLEGPAGHQPEALPWMPGGTSQALPGSSPRPVTP